MRSDCFVYLSGPITAKDGRSVEQNVADAVEVYWRLLRQGIPCFCPHLSGAFPTAFTVDYQTWIDYDYRVIDRCTHLLMLSRWDTSKGAQLEMDYAARHGIPVALSERQLLAMLEQAA